MAGINFVRRWVMSQMTKKADDGIMITLPEPSKVDLNVNITMDRLLRNGINPDSLTNPQQVDNAINMINSRMVERAIPANSAEGREITEKLFGKQKAPVFDLEGNRIPEGSGIMGGKAVKELMDSGQVSKGARGMKKSKKVQDREMFQKSNLNKTEAQLKAEMEASNKKGIAGIKNKRQLTEDEIAELDMDIGGLEYTNDFDGTVGSANKLRKERADYIREMELEYKKGNLDPEPGSGTSQRKRFLQKKLEEAESSGDARLMSREEREELFDLDDIPEYATGGRAGFANGLSVEEMLNKERKQKGVAEDPLTSTNTIPNLLDPKVMSNIAIETGLPTTTQKFDTGGYFKEKLDYPSASDASTIKSIQDFKRGPDRFTAPEISDFMGVEGIFKGLNPEQVQSIYDKVETDDSDPYADIEGQTAFLDPISLIIGGGKLIKGAKASALAKEFLRNKAKQKIGKTIYDKAMKKINTSKYPQGPSKIKTGGGGGGGGSSQANVGGGSTAKNSKGQTASQATAAGTGTSQGYSQHYADGGITRANFVGGGMGRRGFLKMLAGAGAGIAGLKSGLVNILGKGGTKEVAKEVVKQSAGTPPPYFFKLAEKIKMLGDDVTATTDRTISKSLKSKDGKSDYILEEDMVSGDTLIKKVNKEGDEMITDVEIMELRKGEVVRGPDGKPVKTPDSYEEVTETNSRIYKDDYNASSYEDGMAEQAVNDIMKEVGEQAPSIKKASGGIARLGYQVGGDVSYDATDPIYGSSAATFTPDTVMDQFGNQVQSELGNNFNKPLIPQVTEQAVGRLPMSDSNFSPLSGIPAAGGMGGLGETDMPIAGGINNEMGILPVMPQDGSPKDARFRDPGPGIGTGGKLEQAPQYYTGKDYGPGKGMAYTAVAPQRGMRFVYDQNGGRHSVPIEGYEGPVGNPIKSLDQSSAIKFASGGIARMLGE